MAVSLVWALQAVLFCIALGGIVGSWYSFARYPWHKLNRSSRIPVRDRTAETARYCVSVAFLLFTPLVVSGVLSFTGTMARIRARAVRGPPEYTVVERFALIGPWDLLTAGLVAVVVILLLVPLGLVAIDIVQTLLGWRKPSSS